jgi:hypothetical protein
MKKRFEVADDLKVKSMEEVCDIFLKNVLDHEEALVTDESYLSNFSPMEDVDKADGPGSKPGFYKFKLRFFRGNFSERKDQTKWQTKEWEAQGIQWRLQVIEKTKQVFGVDITTVFDLTFPEIIQHIIENYVPKSKQN